MPLLKLIDLNNLKQLSSKLRSLPATTVPAKKATESKIIPQVAARAAAQQFATNGAHGGQPWRPLKPATIKYKIYKKYPSPASPLVATAQLRATATKESSYKVTLAGTNKIIVTLSGNHAELAVVNADRPVLLFSKEDLEEISREVGQIAGTEILAVIK